MSLDVGGLLCGRGGDGEDGGVGRRGRAHHEVQLVLDEVERVDAEVVDLAALPRVLAQSVVELLLRVRLASALQVHVSDAVDDAQLQHDTTRVTHGRNA